LIEKFHAAVLFVLCFGFGSGHCNAGLLFFSLTDRLSTNTYRQSGCILLNSLFRIDQAGFLSLCMKFRYKAKNSRLNAKKSAILADTSFHNTGFSGFANIGLVWFLYGQDIPG
jgi:hypothetical protein